MITDRRKFLTVAAAFAGALALGPTLATARARFYGTRGKAIKGYDPVAYFTAQKPVKGNSKFSTKWQGATWLFSSAENLAAFQANPEKFAPQYGGYCAWAMTRGDLAPIIPEAWDVVDGKLYLNYDLSIRKQWRRNIPKHIARADGHWPKVSKRLS